MNKLMIPFFLTILVMSACSQEPVDYEQLTLAEVQKLVEQGDPGAQVNLGMRYSNGEGVSQDSAEAVGWYRMAAEQGDAVGQLRLGFGYRFGEGVPQNDAESVQWIRAAAEQGDALGMVWLGVSYEDGVGIPQDYVEAHKWFSLSTASGRVAEDTAYLDDLAKKMTSEQVNEAQRLATAWEPKEWEVLRQELNIE